MKIKEILTFLGIWFMMGNWVVIFYTFAYAFQNDWWCVQINTYGEKYIELLIMVIAFLISLYAVLRLSKKLLEGKSLKK